MNAAVLADSRPLIASPFPEESEHRLTTDGKDLSGVARRAGKVAWSLLCLSGLAVLLVCGCLVCFGTLAMVASVLGARESAWWPVITCMVLLYLLAKGCITCWDGACGAFSSWKVCREPDRQPAPGPAKRTFIVPHRTGFPVRI